MNIYLNKIIDFSLPETTELCFNIIDSIHKDNLMNEFKLFNMELKKSCMPH